MVGKNKLEVVSIKIELELESLEDIRNLFDKNAGNDSIHLNYDEIELKLVSESDELSFGGEATVELLMTFSVGVASGVVGNIIYTYLCSHAKKLLLNNQRTLLKEEKITKVVETTKVIEKRQKKITRTKKKEITTEKKVDSTL